MPMPLQQGQPTMPNLEILADFDAQAVNGGGRASQKNYRSRQVKSSGYSCNHDKPMPPHHIHGNHYANSSSPLNQTNNANITATATYGSTSVDVLQGNLALSI